MPRQSARFAGEPDEVLPADRCRSLFTDRARQVPFEVVRAAVEVD